MGWRNMHGLFNTSQITLIWPHSAMQVLLLQTAARVWDALLNEGPKVLFRVALALLKTSEAVLLKQDNVGLLLREVRLAVTHTHDRDKLMKVIAAQCAAHQGCCNC